MPADRYELYRCTRCQQVALGWPEEVPHRGRCTIEHVECLELAVVAAGPVEQQSSDGLPLGHIRRRLRSTA